MNKYMYETNLLESLLNEYSNIKLCLDFGRIHLQECLDDNYNVLFEHNSNLISDVELEECYQWIGELVSG